MKCTCMMRSFHPVIKGKFVDFYSFDIHTSFTFFVALSQDESEWLINMYVYFRLPFPEKYSKVLNAVSDAVEYSKMGGDCSAYQW